MSDPMFSTNPIRNPKRAERCLQSYPMTAEAFTGTLGTAMRAVGAKVAVGVTDARVATNWVSAH